MNMHVNVENLMYKFIEFLEYNSLYAKMTIKKMSEKQSLLNMSA